MSSCVFTIDVEDWFHILDVPSTPPLAQWPSLQSDVERNTRRMLGILREEQVKCTLFFLAWVAERWPHLVREALADGHEVASHGYAHELVYSISEKAFSADIRKAKDIIEQAGGQQVLGYRCPGFSVTVETPWFFDRVREAGYVYDSSVFPGSRGHGGLPQANPVPHVVSTAHGDLVEFPISLGSLMGRRMYFFGGGYLRFFPYWLIRDGVKAVLAEDRPVIFYLHPREIDPAQPRLPMSRRRSFMSYVGLNTTETKMRKLFNEFVFTTFAEELRKLQGPKPKLQASRTDGTTSSLET
ncbi:MAG: XrtA system polysaccharide deacetylase [Flavobacteriales bacterium]